MQLLSTVTSVKAFVVGPIVASALGAYVFSVVFNVVRTKAKLA
jgi:hypothetical protein